MIAYIWHGDRVSVTPNIVQKVVNKVLIEFTVCVVRF